MKASYVKSIVTKHIDDIAFIIGNGINRYSGNNISWEDLLLELWSQYADTERKEIPKGISFTEFYDALDIQNPKEQFFSNVLQKAVKQKMLDWTPSDNQKMIFSKIREMNAPILSTNFDDLIKKSLDLELYKMTRKSFTDHYPWSSYYSDRELSTPLSGFGVWHPNGMIHYHRSIKLGLSQYMGNVERARKKIKNHPENISINDTPWVGDSTWLSIFFNKSLFIFGLGLNEDEVYIRWLLIERAKHFKTFGIKDHTGWYLTTKGSVSEGKRFFLESVGFEVIEVDSYDIIYRDIWE